MLELAQLKKCLMPIRTVLGPMIRALYSCPLLIRTYPRTHLVLAENVCCFVNGHSSRVTFREYLDALEYMISVLLKKLQWL